MSSVKLGDQVGSGPSITIGTKIPEKKVSGFESPGPGYYNAYRKSSVSELQGHTIQNRPNDELPSLTRNADFLTPSSFLPANGIKIGIRDKLSYNRYNQASERKFDLGSTVSKQGFTIRPKTSMRTIDESIPGPGSYSIPTSENRKGISFSKAKSYDLWEAKDLEDNPGPGAYDVVSFTKPKRWAERLRVRPGPDSGYVSRPSLLEEIASLSKPASPK